MPDAKITADVFWDTMPPWIHQVHPPCSIAASHHWSYHGTHHCGATQAAGEIYLYPGNHAYKALFKAPGAPAKHHHASC